MGVAAERLIKGTARGNLFLPIGTEKETANRLSTSSEMEMACPPATFTFSPLLPNE
jgi:hypothetical protein